MTKQYLTEMQVDLNQLAAEHKNPKEAATLRQAARIVGKINNEER